MKKLLIEWKHFDKNGKTCERCSNTGHNLNQILNQLKEEYRAQGIEIQYKETKLPESLMAESNQILLDGELIENIIPNAKLGENHCNSCSDLIDNPQGCNCRTITYKDKTYETIPVDLIKQAIASKLGIEQNYKLKDKKSMKIQVLGSGCPTCKKLYEITQKAVSEMGLKEKVEYLSGSEGMQALIEIGSMTSPVLAVNGNVVLSGFTPDIQKIKKVITSGSKTKEKTPKCSCSGGCC